MRWWELILFCLLGGIVSAVVAFLLYLIFYNWQIALWSAIGCGIGSCLGCLIVQIFELIRRKLRRKNK